MNRETLDRLAEASNAGELRLAIEELCRPVGSLKNIHVFPVEHGAEYMCVVELDSPILNLSIIEKFGGINFGNGVAFRVPNATVADRQLHRLANERAASKPTPENEKNGIQATKPTGKDPAG